MTKYNGSIKNILQGVSQQARRDRRPEQVGAEENCINSITKGTGKRHGTLLGATGLNIPNFVTAAKHSYDRGDGAERYMLCVNNDSFYVVDLLTGTLRSTSGTYTYLDDKDTLGRDPKDYIKFFTIADTTIVANTTAVPTMSGALTAPDTQVAIHCVAANYGRTYSITSNGTTIASYTTPSTVTLATTSSTQEVNKEVSLQTSEIMEELWNGGLSAWVTANGVTARRSADYSCVVLEKTTGGSFGLEVFDDNNNNDLKIVGQEHDRYDDLPINCTDDFRVKITGVDKDEDNDYYVTFVRGDSASTCGAGHWKEDIGFGIDPTLDAALMPWKITRETDGSFTLEENEWADRVAGDDDTNPKPSFVGKTINGIAIYQDRLVLISEENLVGSVTYDQFNLFSPSVRYSDPTDPLDTASSDNTVTNLEHVLVFNTDLLVFSDKAQFVHTGDIAFTSDLFALSSKSRYNTETSTPPVASAASVFFPFNFGEYTGIKELKVDTTTGVLAAEDVTGQVPEYILGSASQILSSTDYNLLLVRSEDDPKDLYVYEWFDRDGARQQAAWHKWTFKEDILHINIIRDTLYLWYSEGGDQVGYYIMDLSDRDTTGIDFPVRLDNTVLVQAVEYSGDTDYWKVGRSLDSINSPSWDNVRVIGAADSGVEGAVVDWTALPDDSGVLVRKAAVPDAGATPYFYVGESYTSTIELTNPYVRDSSGRPKTHTRTVLRYMIFNCFNTGYVQFRIARKYGQEYTKEFSSRVINSQNYLLNSYAPLEDASVRVPIRTPSDACTVYIESDSHLPFFVTDIDWTGKYNEKGRRTL